MIGEKHELKVEGDCSRVFSRLNHFFAKGFVIKRFLRLTWFSCRCFTPLAMFIVNIDISSNTLLFMFSIPFNQSFRDISQYSSTTIGPKQIKIAFTTPAYM